MKKNTRNEILWTLGIAVFFVIFLSPLIIALSGSFREVKDSTSYLNLFHSISLQSYGAAFGKMNYFRALGNSILVTGISVVILVVFCAMAGYAIARLKGVLGGFFQIFFLAGMIVSAQMSIIPMYRIVNALHMGNTIAAPIALYVTSALPFSIFLYTNFIKSGVPGVLEEAARIDGAGTVYTFVRICGTSHQTGTYVHRHNPGSADLERFLLWNAVFIGAGEKNAAAHHAEFYR